ncbi:MAG: hemerythrin domain-containing protein [Campylobacterota bacterium]|nr:hemerythrin domain-containing protein [Campylobacterota bacterium]
MFFSLFSSKSQKLVTKWKKEHEELVVLAHKVIAAYSKNDQPAAKKALKELNDLAVDHIMNEDIEFYRLLKDHKKMDDTTEHMMGDFVKTFKGTKITLMNFLTKYSRPDVELDEEFFKTFNSLVGVLGERIAFEENNLYVQMSDK